jgi:hypothetical protein
MASSARPILHPRLGEWGEAAGVLGDDGLFLGGGDADKVVVGSPAAVDNLADGYDVEPGTGQRIGDGPGVHLVEQGLHRVRTSRWRRQVPVAGGVVGAGGEVGVELVGELVVVGHGGVDLGDGQPEQLGLSGAPIRRWDVATDDGDDVGDVGSAGEGGATAGGSGAKHDQRVVRHAKPFIDSCSASGDRRRRRRGRPVRAARGCPLE